MSLIKSVAIAGILLAGAHYFISPSVERVIEAPKLTPRADAAWDKSDAAQKQRHDLIKKVLNARVFLKIEWGEIPRVYVEPIFYTLNVDDKANFLKVVYAYAFDGTRRDDFHTRLNIVDGRSNKVVGTFYWAGGLTLD